MNKPRLTIAIPSFNRAQHLDRQLAWAVRSIGDRWNDCELIVSDNASPDNTAEICDRWKAQSGEHLRIIRQRTNIGLVRNVLACIQAAQGDFVWVIGDDDEIFDHALEWVFNTVNSATASERLSYLHLNIRSRNGYDGPVLQERAYPFEHDKFASPGSTLFQECADLDEGWMLLITANIYKTEIAKAAINHWPTMQNNLAFPLFLSGYAAAQAQMVIRAEPSVLYPHHTGSHLKTWLNTRFHDIAVAYWALLSVGYPPAFIRRRILARASFVTFAVRFPLQFVHSLYVYLRASRLRVR